MTVAAPTLDAAGARLSERMAPWLADDPDRALAWLAATLALAFRDIDTIANVTGESWARMLDPDACPVWALGWLAQFNGVRINPQISEGDQRAQIKQVAGAARGTPAVIAAAGAAFLTGQRRVIMRERDGGAYKLTVITYTSETPDSAAVLAALTAAKPVGITLTYQVIPEDAWDVAVGTWDSETGTWDTP